MDRAEARFNLFLVVAMPVERVRGTTAQERPGPHVPRERDFIAQAVHSSGKPVPVINGVVHELYCLIPVAL
jgi:hypothetical protein